MKVTNYATTKSGTKHAVIAVACENCGHIMVGTKAPVMCPVCAHPQAYFEVNAKNY